MTDIPTIVISNVPGITSSPLWWPVQEYGEIKQYALDVTDHISSPISAASASVQPSGSGEMQISDLTVVGGVLTVTLDGGVAGRTYIIRIIYNTATDQEVWLICISVDCRLEVYPPIVPPSPFFGSPVYANFIPSLRHNFASNSQYI